MIASKDTPATEPKPARPPSRLPLLGSLVVGLLCAYLMNFVVPGMIRVSFLSYLPFYLGLFFFLLYGLLIGAVMFRAGRSAQPAPKGLLLVIGMVVAVTIWAGGLYQEYRTYPDWQDIKKSVEKELKGQLTPQREVEFRHVVAREVTKHWKENYPPGGFVGFLRWMANGEPIECPYVIKEGTYEIPVPPQQGLGFVFRVVVSLALLMFSILSQFLGLASSPATTRDPSPAPSEDVDTSLETSAGSSPNSMSD